MHPPPVLKPVNLTGSGVLVLAQPGAISPVVLHMP